VLFDSLVGIDVQYCFESRCIIVIECYVLFGARDMNDRRFLCLIPIFRGGETHLCIYLNSYINLTSLDTSEGPRKVIQPSRAP
jgi:hypothetical protein